jgi:nucleoside-diphosphate-sugar epimerase
LPTDFDYIYHLGAINGTTNFYKYPNLVLKNNTICDFNIFDFAAKCTNLTRLAYASSSEVVLGDAEHPVPEKTDVFVENIHNARWSYRLAKINSENFLVNSSLPWVILRYFNVYGANSKQGHFIGDQISKIKNGTFQVIGPNETRSFCFVEDAARASIYVANKIQHEIINVGNDREITIGEAVKTIASTMGHTNVSFEELPSLSGSVTNRRPNIQKLRTLMPDYNPTSFEEGIQSVLKP